LDVTIRDVVGTAHINAAVAADRLRGLIDYGNNSPAKLRDIEEHLVKAISDVALARHMSSDDWTETTYVGVWDRG
jgi:hypothetical protein